MSILNLCKNIFPNDAQHPPQSELLLLLHQILFKVVIIWRDEKNLKKIKIIYTQ